MCSLPTPAVGLGLSPLGDTKNKNLGTFLFLLSNWYASSHRVRTIETVCSVFTGNRAQFDWVITSILDLTPCFSGTILTPSSLPVYL